MREKKSTIVPKPYKEFDVIERPRICCIDLTEDVLEGLIYSRTNIYKGSLGKQIKVPKENSHDNHYVLLNYDFPINLHEYDIIIIDMDNNQTIDYKPEEHSRNNITGKSTLSFLSSYPQTIFDPRPLTANFLREEIHHISNRPYLIIAFASKEYSIEYEPVIILEKHNERQRAKEYSIFSFIDFVPLSEHKIGREIEILEMKDNLKSLLEKYKKGITYFQTFYHPTTWKGNKNIKIPNYIPLMKNINGDIVSYFEQNKNARVFMFPQFGDKKDFLLEFLENVAPSIYPEMFPFSTKFKWKEGSDYWLPRHEELANEKEEITKNYKNELNEIDERIDENQSKYKFLHDLISETGDCLVGAVEKYLRWLEFENVRNMDKEKSNSSIKEEDIPIDCDKGLLLIEVKGIGGTSKDSDCSQIAKIKHRRCKERNLFDVYALYLVNHQRYLPPLIRQNPPFTEHQIIDAKNEERGLLSTWQLFNLYFDIEDGILTKEDARNKLLTYGLVGFKPENLLCVGKPKEIYQKGLVCVINIEDIELKLNDEILVENNGIFKKATIKGLMLNEKSIDNVNSGEIGLRLDRKIKKNSLIWKKAK